MQPPYKSSTLLKKLELQKKSKIFRGKTVIAFTDIDGTYLENKHYTPYKNVIEFQKPRYEDAASSFTIFLDSYNIPIVAVTGRQLHEVFNGQINGLDYEDQHLPIFDGIAPSVGTQLYILQDENEINYVKDIEYDLLVKEESNFHRDTLYPICEELKKNIDLKFPDLKFSFQQKDQKTNMFMFDQRTGQSIPVEPYRISFVAKKDIIDPYILQTLVLNFLRSNGFAKIQFIMTIDRDICIDIAAVAKDFPVQYLKKISKVDVGLVAGDSGNDKLMLMHAPSAGFIPNDAKPELINEIRGIPGIKSTEYYVILPNGVPIYIEPLEVTKGTYTGAQSLQASFAAYLSHLIG